MRLAHCVQCHGPFTLNAHGRAAVFCSAPCRRKWHRALERARLASAGGTAWKKLVATEERGAGPSKEGL